MLRRRRTPQFSGLPQTRIPSLGAISRDSLMGASRGRSTRFGSIAAEVSVLLGAKPAQQISVSEHPLQRKRMQQTRSNAELEGQRSEGCACCRAETALAISTIAQSARDPESRGRTRQ